MHIFFHSWLIILHLEAFSSRQIAKRNSSSIYMALLMSGLYFCFPNIENISEDEKRIIWNIHHGSLCQEQRTIIYEQIITKMITTQTNV